MSKSDIKLNTFHPNQLKGSEFNNLILIGPSKSGKTTKVLYILENLISDYQIIMLVSETSDTNKSYNGLISPAFMFNDFADLPIDSMIKSQSDYKKKHPKGPSRRALIIMDDVMKNIDDMKRNKDFKNLFYTGRQYDIYFILSVHFLYAIPKQVRNAVAILVILTMSAPEDAYIMYRSYWDVGFSKDQNSCCEFVNQTTKDGHALVIDNTNRSIKDITKRCFDFWVPKEDADRYSEKKFKIQPPKLTKVVSKIYYDPEWEKKWAADKNVLAK